MYYVLEGECVMLRTVSISKHDASLVFSAERYLKLVFDIFKVRKAIAVLFLSLVLPERWSVGLLGTEGVFSPCQ